VRELEDFYGRSFFYKYVVSITPTVLAITDLADLWYKEFYLELSKKLQFPIEMSLPWILTDHILESRDAAMMEFVLYPLGIPPSLLLPSLLWRAFLVRR
jgi:cytoplasmic FMR1 interacting protein